MATVSQAIRQNIQNCQDHLADLNYSFEGKEHRIKVKSLGGGEYKVLSGNWEYSASKVEAFDEGDMRKMCLSYIENITGVDLDETPDVDVNKTSHGYSLVVGNANNEFAKDTLVDIDCRLDNFGQNTNMVFWQLEDFGFDFLKGVLQEIIGSQPLVVYHYKGKRWHIAPEMSLLEMPVCYLDDDRDIDESWYYRIEGEVLHCIDDTQAQETISELEKAIKLEKDNQENLGVIEIMLDKITSYLEDMVEGYDPENTKDALSSYVFEYYENSEPEGRLRSGFYGMIFDPDNVGVALKVCAPELREQIVGYKELNKLARRHGFDFQVDAIGIELIVNGYSIHISSEEFEDEGCAWAEVYRNIVIPQVQRRMELDAQKEIKMLVGNRIKEVAQNIWVSFSDSMEAGNCQSGSKDFVLRHGIDLDKLGGIRGDRLLELENTEFTQRIIYSKLKDNPGKFLAI